MDEYEALQSTYHYLVFYQLGEQSMDPNFIAWLERYALNQLEGDTTAHAVILLIVANKERDALRLLSQEQFAAFENDVLYELLEEESCFVCGGHFVWDQQDDDGIVYTEQDSGDGSEQFPVHTDCDDQMLGAHSH